MLISVIISTYNRSKILNTMLDSFFEQEFKGNFDYELIIIDNNSTDGTRALVETLVKQKDGKVHYIFEPRKGKSIALNTVISKVKGEMLAFTDDDVTFDKGWLSNIAHFSCEQNVDAIGGKVIPIFPKNSPAWIKENKAILCGPILSHDQGDEIKSYIGKMIPFVGANMIIRKRVFDEIGLFNTAIGAGTGVAGEDSEFFKRMQRHGKNIVYNPEILVFHPVEKERMNLRYIAKWYIGFGRYNAKIYDIPATDKKVICWLGVPRYLIKELAVRFMRLVLNVFNRKKFIICWIEFFEAYGKFKEFKVQPC